MDNTWIKQFNESIEQMAERSRLIHKAIADAFGFNADFERVKERGIKNKMTDKEFLQNAIPMLNDMVGDLNNLQGRLRDCNKSDNEAMKGYIHDRIVGTLDVGLAVVDEMLEALKYEDRE